MRLTRCVVPLVFGVAMVMATSATLGATVYLQENFNSYASDNDFMYYGEWTPTNDTPYWVGWIGEQANPSVDYETYLDMWKRVEIPEAGRTYPKELYTRWALNTNPNNLEIRPAPGTFDGTSSTGQFLISDSKQGSNTFNDMGESFGIWTPAFSTVGASEVWLHCATAAVTNDNYGHSVFFVDVTTDNGATWDTQWTRISPERSTPGEVDPGAISYVPELGVNASGYYGQLDVDLSCAAGQESVMVRFRHYEPSSDYYFAIDDVVVDDVAPARPLETLVFQENFDNGLGQMSTSGSGNRSGIYTWNTNAPVDIWDPEADVLAENTDEHSLDDCITMIEYPCDPSDTPDFALMVWQRGQNTPYDEWMMTPLLDLTDAIAAAVSYEDECLPDDPNYVPLPSGDPSDEISHEDGNQRAYLMRDSNGNGIAESTDEILRVLFDYESPYEDENPYYALRNFDISEAAGRDDCFVAWRYDGPVNPAWGLNKFWAIDSVEVTATMVPEPSTLALVLGGLLMAWIGRRRR